ELSAELSDRTIALTNTVFHPQGGLLDMSALMPVMAIFSSPFEPVQVKRINVKLSATLNRQTAEIKRAYFSKAQLERGETAQLHVVLKPFGKPEVTKTIPVKVPAATDALRQVVLTVVGGDAAPLDAAPPDNLNDYLNAIQKRHRSTELVALLQSPGQGL